MGTNERRRRATYRELTIIAVLLIAAISGLYFFFQSRAQASIVRAVFENGAQTSAVVRLEVAAGESERQKGLMFRKSMAPDHGMLFVFKDEGVRTFWMKDTFIPLDIIFVDKEWKVAGMLTDVPVLNSEKRGIEKPSRYVIELNAGAAARLGVREGSRVRVVAGSVPAGQ